MATAVSHGAGSNASFKVRFAKNLCVWTSC